MSAFNMWATLQTREPNTIEFLGEPSLVSLKVPGTLHLQVDAAVQLSQLSVAFVGEIFRHSLKFLAAPAITDNIQTQLISEPTDYLPGTYKFPFELLLPGDIATTDSETLTADNIHWTYNLVASAVPSGTAVDRKRDTKEIKQSLLVRRVHPTPWTVPGEKARYRIARNGVIECSIFAPSIVDLGQKINHIDLDIQLHLLSERYHVEEVQLKAVQEENVLWRHSSFEKGKSRLNTPAVKHKWDGSAKNIVFGRIGDIASSARRFRDISEPTSVRNALLSSEWGLQDPLHLRIELDSEKILPSEELFWLELTHHFEVTVVFKEKSVEPLKAKVAFKAKKFTESGWIHSTIEDLHLPVVQQQLDAHEPQAEAEEEEEEQIRDGVAAAVQILPDYFESFDQTNGYTQLPSYQESHPATESA